MQIKQIFPIFRDFYTIWLFCPKFANLSPIQLGTIDDIFIKFTIHHCAQFYTDA